METVVGFHVTQTETKFSPLRIWLFQVEESVHLLPSTHDYAN